MSLIDVVMVIGYFGFVVGVVLLYLGAIGLAIGFVLRLTGILQTSDPDKEKLEEKIKSLEHQIQSLRRRW